MESVNSKFAVFTAKPHDLGRTQFSLPHPSLVIGLGPLQIQAVVVRSETFINFSVSLLLVPDVTNLH